MGWFNREYNFLYWFSRSAVKLGFILFFRPTITGLENVPKTGGVILASNHISHLDPPLVGTTCSRKVHFLAKTELFRGLFGWYMSNIGQVEVERGKGKEAVDVAVELLQKGLCICIFPEGTRSRTGEIQKPHTGVVVIAARSGCPIVPVLVEGAFEIMPPKSKFPRLFRKIKIKYGKPFYLSSEENDITSKDRMRQTAEGIMERIKALGNA